MKKGWLNHQPFVLDSIEDRGTGVHQRVCGDAGVAQTGIVVAAEVIGADAMTGQACLYVSHKFGERCREVCLLEISRLDCSTALMTHNDQDSNIEVKHGVLDGTG